MRYGEASTGRIAGDGELQRGSLPAAPVSKVYAALARQGELLGGLHEVIAVLEKRLHGGGVLTPTPTTPSTKDCAVGESHQLADRIGQKNLAIEMAHSRIASIVDALEV